MVKIESTLIIQNYNFSGVNETFPDQGAPERYSSDSKCPNSQSSLYTNSDSCKPWNPSGSDILHQDWSFPIFLVDKPEKMEDLRSKCYEEFNSPINGEARDWPLCAVELKSHMIAAVDTKTCQRRNNLINPFSPILICDPMGDQNIFHLSGANFDPSKVIIKLIADIFSTKII